jgi:hypothetical protein
MSRDKTRPLLLQDDIANKGYSIEIVNTGKQTAERWKQKVVFLGAALVGVILFSARTEWSKTFDSESK